MPLNLFIRGRGFEFREPARKAAHPVGGELKNGLFNLLNGAYDFQLTIRSRQQTTDAPLMLVLNCLNTFMY